ncbi:hypothetical protein P7F60_10570 [Rhizobium sp. YJ-22]|uniref:hypothetical protein n=1 Tax=Rhizobium sp. YJ-22 TaxID=3037556 RepID=UPI001408151C|nr:hypothetical protein [Rhizobium sp. YJ-22]MDG3576833.1 hypothetical protein [Rhizobium sp. YJ-22]
MSKRRKTKKGKSDGGERSFGSGLDEVGWKPRSGTSHLKPRVNKTPNDIRRTYERAFDALVAEGRFGGPSHISTELEILEEATRLVKQAREKGD